LYFRDTGLLCFLLSIESPAALLSSPLSGAVWETFVLGQILRARAATEHWVACRTPNPHTAPGLPGVRLINAISFDGWLDGMDTAG
jgi:hypothetical protein